MTRQLFTLALTTLFFTQCVPNPDKIKSHSTEDLSPTKKGYSIIFFDLNNSAEIYAGNNLIANTENYDRAENKQMLVDLDGKIPNNTEIINIKIFNSKCNSCTRNTWEATYELYKDGKEIAYFSESSNGKHADLGLVYEQAHTLDEL